MRLLFFIHSLCGGGAERVTVNLANHWAAKRWHITIVTLTSRSPDFYELDPTVRRISLELAGGESRNVLAGLWKNLRRVRALRQVLRQVQPDIALALMSTANVILALATRGLANLCAIGAERIHPPQFPLGAQWEALRRSTYGQLAAVVALTQESAEWLRQHTRAHRVPIIPNMALWPLAVQAPRLIPSIRVADRHILLAVGRLDKQKGFDWLLEAFRALAQTYYDWTLVILGEGPERRTLETQVQAARLDGRAFLPGRAGNVGEWYERADLYVMSSRFEGFPNTLAEAMAHGLPAVSFDCDTGPRDIIRPEVDGLLVPPGNVDALTAALDRLMGDAALRAQFAARAVEARARFSMERVAGMWEELFAQLR